MFIEDGAVESVEEFRQLYSRVNSVIPVMSLAGIKVEEFSADVAKQYQLIDAGLSRIKAVLGVNDSFLGMAYASDSGRKVQIQRMASAAQMTNIVDHIGMFFKLVGEDIFKLIKQYYKSHQILRIADPLNEYHYTEINVPILMPTGRILDDGTPEMYPILEPLIDPDSGQIMRDENGLIIKEPATDPDSKLEYADIDIKIVSVKADNSEEQNQIMFQQFMMGPLGNVLLQTNPAGYLKAAAMMVSEFGTKHSIEIARLLIDTASKIEQGVIDPSLAMFGGDIKAIIEGEMSKAQSLDNRGGSTGHIENTQGGIGAPNRIAAQTGGNPMGIPQAGNVGGNGNV